MMHACNSKHVSKSLKASFSFDSVTEQSFRKFIMDPSLYALMDESFDSWLAEDWTASQGNELIPLDDEEELVVAACQIEEKERTREKVKKVVDMILNSRDVIKTKKTDEFCLARALICTKAYVDQDPRQKNIIYASGTNFSSELLQNQARVPKGRCGLPEIQKFQAFLGPQGYQIKVYVREGGVLWFCDEKYEDAPKKLCLLKVNEEFHGLRNAWRVVNFLASYSDPDDIQYGRY